MLSSKDPSEGRGLFRSIPSVLQAGSARLRRGAGRGRAGCDGDAPLPALPANFSPSSSSEQSGRKFMPFGFKKRLLEEKRKGREKENENDFNFFLA